MVSLQCYLFIICNNVVIEKCIKLAPVPIRNAIIDELITQGVFDRLLKDAFGNYVVQTAIENADLFRRQALIECIRPILPLIRGTPHVKRIQSKFFD